MTPDECGDAERRAENRNLTDPEEIEKAIRLGEFIRNGASLLTPSSSVP